MNEMTIKFNDVDYIAKYNKQTGYYELDLTAPEIGGIYETEITFSDLFEEISKHTIPIQILAKEQIKIETNKVFMWIFDYKDFSVKDIIELSDYELNIDDETNSNSTIKVLKKTTAKSRDIIAVKKNNECIFWGIIDNIQNENGEKLYEYTVKHITNMFDEKVPLFRNVENDFEDEIKNGIEEQVYRIRSALDITKVIEVANGSMENRGNVQLWEDNGTDAQKWKIRRDLDGCYKFENVKSGKVFEVTDANYANQTNVEQYENNSGDAQKWRFSYLGGALHNIKTKLYNYCVDVRAGDIANGTNIQIFLETDVEADKPNQQFILERLDEELIKDYGIEDYLKKMIEDNFINSPDIYTNKSYIEVRVKTHTKLRTSVTNVEDNLYNLKTWMLNCTKLYNINYDFYVENKKLIIEIENKTLNRELIDVKAQAISNYTEVFEIDAVSKVEVLTSKQTYTLFLLNDRTTTTDINNANRAEGTTERIYTQNYEDAPQKALDIIQANRYNHYVSFLLYNKFIKLGTPISIKTKESIIFDTYISAIKITQNKFIDKLLKERNK